MAVPRAAMLAIVGVLLIAGAFAATQLMKKKDDGSGGGSTPPAEAAPTPSKAKANKATPAAPKPEPKPEVQTGVTEPVARALDAKRVVVLVLTQDGADDDATIEAARAVRGVNGVEVVNDSIDNVSKYRRITAGLGVSQAPAVVVVNRKGQGLLLEGYTDPGSLRQLVEDARR